MGFLGQSCTGRFKGQKNQKGLAVVEMAVVLPLLTLLLVVLIEFGLMFKNRITVTKAVENGARFIGGSARTSLGVILAPLDIANVQNLVVYGNVLGSGDPLLPGLAPGNVNVSCTYGSQDNKCNEQNGVTSITVNLNYNVLPFYGNTLLNISGADLNIPLTASVTMSVVN